MATQHRDGVNGCWTPQGTAAVDVRAGATVPLVYETFPGNAFQICKAVLPARWWRCRDTLSFMSTGALISSRNGQGRSLRESLPTLNEMMDRGDCYGFYDSHGIFFRDMATYKISLAVL